MLGMVWSVVAGDCLWPVVAVVVLLLLMWDRAVVMHVGRIDGCQWAVGCRLRKLDTHFHVVEAPPVDMVVADGFVASVVVVVSGEVQIPVDMSSAVVQWGNRKRAFLTLVDVHKLTGADDAWTDRALRVVVVVAVEMVSDFDDLVIARWVGMDVYYRQHRSPGRWVEQGVILDE